MEKLPITSNIEVISERLPREASIALANDKQFIYYQPSKKVNLKIRPGDILTFSWHTNYAETGTMQERILENIYKTVLKSRLGLTIHPKS